MELHVYMPRYGWDKPDKEPGRQASYGDFKGINVQHTDKNAAAHLAGRVGYVVPELLSYGDYDNSCLVQRSNYRVFLERFGKVDGVVELSGGYGTAAIAIRVDLLTSHEELKDVIEGLDNYSLIDEEDHSELEQKAINEAWKDWGQKDFVSGLLDELGDKFNERSLKKVIRHKIFSKNFKQMPHPFEVLFYSCMERANEYWQDEGGEMTVAMGEIVAYAVEYILLATMPRNELPLLIGQEWKSKEALKIFEELLRNPESVLQLC